MHYDSPRLVFSTTVEPFIKPPIAPKLSAACLAKLQEIGLDKDRIFPAYTVDQHRAFIDVISEDLFPGVQLETRHHRLGVLFMNGVDHSFFGRAMFAVLRAMGVERSVERIAKSMKTGGNFIDMKSERVGPGHFQLTMNDTGDVPYYFAGVFEGGTHAIGAQDVQCRVAQLEGRRCVYALTWK